MNRLDEDILKVLNEDIEYDKYGLYYDSQGEIVQCKFPKKPSRYRDYGGNLIEIKLGQALQVEEFYPGFDKGDWKLNKYICIVEKIENKYIEGSFGEDYKTVLWCKGVCTFTGDSLKDAKTIYIEEDSEKVCNIAILTDEFLNSRISDAENLVRKQQECVDRLKSMQQYV